MGRKQGLQLFRADAVAQQVHEGLGMTVADGEILRQSKCVLRAEHGPQNAVDQTGGAGVGAAPGLIHGLADSGGGRDLIRKGELADGQPKNIQNDGLELLQTAPNEAGEPEVDQHPVLQDPEAQAGRQGRVAAVQTVAGKVLLESAVRPCPRAAAGDQGGERGISGGHGSSLQVDGMAPEIVRRGHDLAALRLKPGDQNRAVGAGDDQTGLRQSQGLAGRAGLLRRRLGLIDLERGSAELRRGDGPWVQTPDLRQDGAHRAVPVDGTERFIQHGGVGGKGGVLRRAGRGPGGDGRKGIPKKVRAEDGKPVGPIVDGDSVILFNFRGDRALEISRAFEDPDLKEFDRKRLPKVEYAGMMEYDGDLHIPHQYLVAPPSINRTLAEYLCASGVMQFSISETQKFGHITYFFNGNRSGKFDDKLEEYVEIPSDIVPFEQRPWMKCAEIADRVIKEIESGKWSFIKMNFPNGDMVGHTGVYEAVVCSMEALDLQIGRIRAAVEKAGGVLLITADHGNADDMYEHDKAGEVKRYADGSPRPKTSHSLNPVPCILYDPCYHGEYSKEMNKGLGISSIAATCMTLLGFVPPADYDKSVINLI